VKRAYIQILLILFFSASFQLVMSQQINTLYFMENMPLRHTLNPAFQPETKYYISLPVVGGMSMDFGNNSVTLQDVIYNYNGQTITFLDANGDVDAFYKKLKPTTVFNADFQVNLLSFGFKKDHSFWNFSLTQKMQGVMMMPKDLFKLTLYGTPDIFENSYNLNLLHASVSYYTEAALGFSTQLDDQWTIGAKVKFLYGTANMSTTNNYFSFNAGLEKVQLNAKGSLNYAGEVKPFEDFLYSGIFSIRKPSGLGAGVDLGAQLRLTSNLYLSASITDLGFISWTKNVGNINYQADYSYNGIAQMNNGADLSALTNTLNRIGTVNPVVDSLLTALQNSVNIKQTSTSYTTGTTAKVNLGAEYKFLSNKLSAGLLLRQFYYCNYISNELTASVNAFPNEWLNATLSYSVFYGSNTFGGGLGIRTGFVHWFTALDYMPLKKTTLSSLQLNGLSLKNIPLPYNLRSFNLSVGANIVFDELFKDKNKRTQTSEGRPMNTRTGLFHSKFKDDNDCNCN
jgi:hypothetical protein